MGRTRGSGYSLGMKWPWKRHFTPAGSEAETESSTVRGSAERGTAIRQACQQLGYVPLPNTGWHGTGWPASFASPRKMRADIAEGDRFVPFLKLRGNDERAAAVDGGHLGFDREPLGVLGDGSRKRRLRRGHAKCGNGRSCGRPARRGSPGRA